MTTQAFDKAAIRAAMQAVAEQAAAVKPLTIPGVGRVFKRELLVADVEQAQSLRAKLAEKHPELGERGLGMAVGLAQTLCGPDGEPIFDPENVEDIKLLAGVPWATVRGVSADEDGEAQKNA